jgi:predicted RNase H-like nuclease (RuvC/YqgF family)
VTTLVRVGPPDDHDVEGLRARAAELEASLAERATELARLQAELAAFKVEYRKHVGLLHDELDELERAIADIELGARIAQIAEDGAAPGEPSSSAPAEPAPRYTSDAVRKLFRDVAKAIHPDLAHADVTQDWRHALMVEANRAYALGDEERLRWILQAWERSPHAVQGEESESARLRLVRRIGQLEEQLEAFTAELAELKDSPISKMKAMVDESAARGKNLIRDMVGRLKRDILAARNRLDAMQSRS